MILWSDESTPHSKYLICSYVFFFRLTSLKTLAIRGVLLRAFASSVEKIPRNLRPAIYCAQR